MLNMQVFVKQHADRKSLGSISLGLQSEINTQLVVGSSSSRLCQSAALDQTEISPQLLVRCLCYFCVDLHGLQSDIFYVFKYSQYFFSFSAVHVFSANYMLIC